MKTSQMNAERSFHKQRACRLPMLHARYAFDQPWKIWKTM